MLAKKFEKPKKIGDKSMIRVMEIRVGKSCENSGKNNLIKNGANMNATTATVPMTKKNTVKMESMNSFASDKGGR